MKHKIIIAFIAIAAVILGSCSGMDDLADKWYEQGEIIYGAKLDSALVYPGNNRLQLDLFVSAQHVKTAVIYWNNNQDSTAVDLGEEPGVYSVIISDLPEQNYVFNIVDYDTWGNKSLALEVLGKTYGENYRSELGNQRYTSLSYSSETHELRIVWATILDGMVGKKLTYTDVDGNVQTVDLDLEESTTTISDVAGNVSYYCIFKPTDDAIDEFASDPREIPLE